MEPTKYAQSIIYPAREAREFCFIYVRQVGRTAFSGNKKKRASLWFVLVHESRTVYRTYDIPVRSAELFSDLMVTEIEPENVSVKLSGQRKSFYFLNEHDIKLNLKLWQLGTGKSTVRLAGSDFTIPEGLEYENAVPRDVTVTIASQTQKDEDKN